MNCNGILLGTAGVYHVMSELALRKYHAAATHGNAPDLDILVCSPTGEKSFTIQVKSASNAKRKIKGVDFLDFPFSYKAGITDREGVYFAFVDFGVSADRKPDVYLIRSKWMYNDFCKPWIDKYAGKMVRFSPKAEWVEKFKNNWDFLKDTGVVPEEQA